MSAPKVIRSFYHGEIIVDGLPFKKGFHFCVWDKEIESWKAGRPIPVSDSYCKHVMIDADNIRIVVKEWIEVERDIARNG